MKKQIQELMTRSPAYCTPETPLREVARLMADRHFGCVPVIDSADGRRKVIGVITDRDIVCRSIAMGKDPLSMSTREAMSTPAVTCSEEATVDECCQLMEDNQIRRIPVVDAQGELVGIVAQADIAEHSSRGVVGHVVRAVSKHTERASNVH